MLLGIVLRVLLRIYCWGGRNRTVVVQQPVMQQQPVVVQQQPMMQPMMVGQPMMMPAQGAMYAQQVPTVSARASPPWPARTAKPAKKNFNETLSRCTALTARSRACKCNLVTWGWG